MFGYWRALAGEEEGERAALPRPARAVARGAAVRASAATASSRSRHHDAGGG